MAKTATETSSLLGSGPSVEPGRKIDTHIQKISDAIRPPAERTLTGLNLFLDRVTFGLWHLWMLRKLDGLRVTSATRAAWLVEDAMKGLPPRDRPPDMHFSVRKSYLIYQDLDMLYTFTVLLVVLLTICETPLWCLATGSTATRPWAYHPPHVTCPAPDGGFIYLGNVPYLPVAWGVMVELFCYMVWLIRSALVYFYNGRRAFGPGTRLWQARLIATVAAIVDSIIYLTIIFVPDRVPIFRVAPFARLVHIITLDSVVSLLKLMPAVIGPFLNIFVIYVGAWCFVGFVFCIALDDVSMPIGRCAAQARIDKLVPADECDAVNAGFDSFGAAFYSMMVASTNAAVPDQQIPAYTEHRVFGTLWAFAYFGINFVMLSLILAVVYNAYAEALKDSVLAHFTNRAQGLAKAYHILRGAQPEVAGLTPDAMQQLFTELNECVGSAIPHVPPKHYKYIIATIDDDSSGLISMREFADFLDIVQYSYKRVQKRSYMQRKLPSAYASLRLDGLKRFIYLDAKEGWGAERIMLAVMLLNAVVVGVESYEDYYNLEGKYFCCTTTQWGWIDASFALVYIINIGLTLLVTPWDRYWLSTANRFDFVVSVSLGLVAFLWIYPSVHVPNEVLRYLNLVRLMQLLRLFSHSEQFSFIADCLFRIAIGASPFCLMLFATTSCWCVIGCQAFGGYVYGGNPKLLDSDLYEANMDVLNFNDFPSSLMVFLPTLVSGGPYSELIDAFATSCGTFVSILFFMSYFYSIFFVVFNCFVSFIIDAFVARYELQKSDELDKEEEEQLASLYATFDDPEHDVIAQARTKGSEELYKRMFAEEMEEIAQNLEQEFMEDDQENARVKEESNKAEQTKQVEEKLADVVKSRRVPAAQTNKLMQSLKAKPASAEPSPGASPPVSAGASPVASVETAAPIADGPNRSEA